MSAQIFWSRKEGAKNKNKYEAISERGQAKIYLFKSLIHSFIYHNALASNQS